MRRTALQIQQKLGRTTEAFCLHYECEDGMAGSQTNSPAFRSDEAFLNDTQERDPPAELFRALDAR